MQPHNYALKPLKLWAKTNLSFLKLFSSGIMSQQQKVTKKKNKAYIQKQKNFSNIGNKKLLI
jgi:hypothetical protein